MDLFHPAQTRETLTMVCRQFGLPGELIGFQRIPTGRINATFCAMCSDGNGVHRFLIQRVNPHVFQDPVAVMENIRVITEHLRQGELGPSSRECLQYYETVEGKNYILLDGALWRVRDYLENTVSVNAAEGDVRLLRRAGAAFGRFSRRLLDLDPRRLTETIPGFHDTNHRLRTLFQSSVEDPVGRTKTAEREMAVFQANRTLAETLCRQLQWGGLPLRVTHNDTKTDNVLFDRDTLEPVAVIDLDTCMPGLICYDFGDLVRSGASVGEGTEKWLDLNRFQACAEGYLSETAGFLTGREISSLVPGAMAVTLELAARFLSDYLVGDRYFRAEHPIHNLLRARGQLALFHDMKAHEEEMKEILRACKAKACSEKPIPTPYYAIMR